MCSLLIELDNGLSLKPDLAYFLSPEGDQGYQDLIWGQFITQFLIE